MNTITTTFVIVLFAAAASSHAGWRSRARKREETEQQRIADSIRVADSIRRADSIRVADSLRIEVYRKQEEKLEEEARREKRERAAAKKRAAQARKDTVPDKEPEGDMFSARRIVIDPTRIDTSALDSLEHEVDSLMALVCSRYRGMKRLRKTRMPRKLRFFRAQLRGARKDTADVRSCCEMLHHVQELKLAKLRLILEGQDGDNRAFVNLHIKGVMNEMHQLAEFMIALAPEKPYQFNR